MHCRKKFSIEVSVYMLELYNEKLLDLLAIGKDISSTCQRPRLAEFYMLLLLLHMCVCVASMSCVQNVCLCAIENGQAIADYSVESI